MPCYSAFPRLLLSPAAARQAERKVSGQVILFIIVLRGCQSDMSRAGKSYGCLAGHGIKIIFSACLLKSFVAGNEYDHVMASLKHWLFNRSLPHI